MSNEKDKLFTYETLVHAIAGATGSMVGMTVFYPLDTVRSRLQLDENRESKNAIAVMKDLVEEEGLYTLYRGIFPVLKSLCASNFIYFYTFHGLKSFKNNSLNQSASRDLLLASVAGVINVLTTTPLWVVNTRLKMQGINDCKNLAYDGLLSGLVHISKTEGISSLWSSTLPSLILVSNPAIQFMTYEAIKRKVNTYHGTKDLGSVAYFLMGALSKAIATGITYPLQLIQNKQRHGHNFKNLPKDIGMIPLILYILKNFGLKGLFKGMEAKLLQTVMTAALMFLTYEKIIYFVFKILNNPRPCKR